MGLRKGGVYVDGTLGSGGHAGAVLERIGPDGFLLGIDRDAAAVERSKARLAGWGARCRVVQGNYADMGEIAGGLGIKAVDGILLDVGFSSDQIEQAERGFSFMNDGPLDMRMDPSQGMTAADFVNRAGEQMLIDVLREYGEEPSARRIAGAIVEGRKTRPFSTTLQLAQTVEQATGGRRGRIHPATRTFQALRIEVNGELENLRRGLECGVALLKQGGRFGVISFHSLEDRIVKRFFVSHAGRWESLQAGGRKWVGEEPAVGFVNKKPAIASDEENAENPRARSAKLRVVERIETPKD